MNRVGILAVGVAGALALACGNNPAKYLVALDQSGLAALPGSCYPTGVPPNPAPQIMALASHEFTVWEGAKGVRYLEIDRVQVSFPSSTFSFIGLVEGGPKTWSFSSTADRANATTESRQMLFTFTDLGSTLQGSVSVTNTYSCAAPPCGFQDCSVTLGLNGRQVDATGAL